MNAPRLAFIVNPVAGVGGPAGLKGSDGVVAQALARGALPQAQVRAEQALAALVAHAGPGTQVTTAAGAMGADVARAAGLGCAVVHQPAEASSAIDTKAAVNAAIDDGADLVVFVGGDGTARDVADAAAGRCPILGVPAGVKMYSACFAVSPAAAGALAAKWVAGERGSVEAEVLDLDETLLGAGTMPRLHTVVQVPRGRTQPRKSPAGGDVGAAAAGAVALLQQGVTYLLGPGSTTAAIARHLGVPSTPLGVDVVRDEALVCADAHEAQLLEVVNEGPARAIVTIIGGQGFVLGRGNQQLSPAVLRALVEPGLLIVADACKIGMLAGAPLLVDTGDEELDRELAGFHRVVTGPNQSSVYRIEPAGGMT